VSIPAPKLSEGECRFGRCVGLYADGELDAPRAMDVETHLLSCTACAERLELLRATRVSLKRCSPGRTGAPPAFRARIAIALQRSCTSGSEGGEGVNRSGVHQRTLQRGFDPESGLSDAHFAEAGSQAPRLIRLRYAMAMAAAAGIAFGMGAWRLQDGRRFQDGASDFATASTKPATASAKAGAAGEGNASPGASRLSGAEFEGAPMATSGIAVSHGKFDRMLEDLVALHADPLPPEMTNPDELQRFDPLVGVPVRRPAFQAHELRFNGARVHAMRDRRAAVLQYTTRSGHRVTMYVFNPEAMAVSGTRLEARVVRERPVYVGHFRGYSIAATEQRGVGYALASDLDDDKSAQMVASVAH
jgi:anti-sigma factor RsiW